MKWRVYKQSLTTPAGYATWDLATPEVFLDPADAERFIEAASALPQHRKEFVQLRTLADAIEYNERHGVISYRFMVIGKD